MGERIKIYFAGAIRGGREDWHTYGQLIMHLKRYGDVLTKHIGRGALGIDIGESALPDEDIFDRDMAWLEESDVFIADVSVPSLGVGYEIAVAEREHKPVLCLYNTAKEKQVSARILGNKSITVKKYDSLDAALAQIDDFMKKLQ